MRKFPTNATISFMELCDEIARYPVQDFGPGMREALMAQWALESGWGTSDLAKKHLNFGGAKWRDTMKPYATKVSYRAHDGQCDYCHFKTLNDYITGYFHRLDTLGPYDGWRVAAKKGGLSFIGFIGPIWLGLGAKENQEYVAKIRHLMEERFGWKP